MRIIFTFIVLANVIISPRTVRSEAIVCPMESEGAIQYSTLPRFDGVPQKMVVLYVGFSDVPAEPGFIDQNRLQDMPDRLQQFYSQQSQGDLVLDSNVLLNPADPEGFWMADHRSTQYTTLDSVLAIPPQYEDLWPTGGTSYWLSELQSEVLFKVYNSTVELGMPNPFEGATFVVFMFHGDVVYIQDENREDPGVYAGGNGATMVVRGNYDFLATASTSPQLCKTLALRRFI